MTFYIFVNNDINMSTGKTMAQVSHITQVVVDKIISDFYEEAHEDIPQYYIDYMEWKKYDKTVVLKANDEQIRNLLTMDGIMCYEDNGILTTLAFLPSDKHSFDEYEKY